VAVQIVHGECIQTQVAVDGLEVNIAVTVPGIVPILNLLMMGTLADLRRPLPQGAKVAYCNRVPITEREEDIIIERTQ
jgi:transposase